jgi:putative restriction endonuclease
MPRRCLGIRLALLADGHFHSGLCEALLVGSGSAEMARGLLGRFTALRQHRRNGQRSPHKPLLVLLALGRLAETGSSVLPWSVAEPVLADLIAEFGPPSRTGRAQSAAYPFTRLRADGVWVLDQDVPMDLVSPLADRHVVGQFERSVEAALRDHPALARSVARALVLSNFPDTVAPDVMEADGLDPRIVLGGSGDRGDAGRRRDPGWRAAVLQAWDRQCAFCGYDGQLAGATAGIDAAHVRWFAFDGPDALDNGLALCALHHKLFDLGALGLDASLRVQVSAAFTARTIAGRALYDLDGRPLAPRPGTSVPAAEHVSWHRREVFKGAPLLAESS